MAYLPWLDGKSRQTVATEVFGGINRGMKAQDGEWAETRNMGSGSYPVFSQRKHRGVVGNLTAPHGLTAKEHLCYVDGNKLYYNGEVVEGKVSSWTDFEDGDQIQVKIDGKTYLVHSSNVVLISD